MYHSPGFLAIVDDAKSRIREIDIAALVKMREASTPHLLVDTREDGEWAAGRITGAIHIGRGIIERDIEVKVPEKETLLVLYCGGGYRSALAADNLQRMGYSNCFSLAEGWRGWIDRGLPTET